MTKKQKIGLITFALLVIILVIIQIGFVIFSFDPLHNPFLTFILPMTILPIIGCVYLIKKNYAKLAFLLPITVVSIGNVLLLFTKIGSTVGIEALFYICGSFTNFIIIYLSISIFYFVNKQK